MLRHQAVLICPICKTLFQKAQPSQSTIPTCCTLRCVVTLRVTCADLRQAEKILADVSQRQDLFGDHPEVMIEHDLADLVHRPVCYGSFATSPEAEQSQQVADLVKIGVPLPGIATLFAVSLTQIHRLHGVGLMGRKAMRILITTRRLLQAGASSEEIAIQIGKSVRKTEAFLRRYAHLIHPLDG